MASGLAALYLVALFTLRPPCGALARNLLRILLLTTLALLVTNLPVSAEISQRDQKAIADAGTCESPQSALQSCGLIYIATVRKNRTQSTAATVWFITGA